MSEILIIFIEFLLIIILCLIIRGFVRERRMRIDEIGKHYTEAAYTQAEHKTHILKQANVIRLKLSQELYRDSFKKNIIVKEACTRFYEELAGRLT